MNDPTNWDTGAFNEGLGTFKDSAMAHEVARRCNAYPELIDLLTRMCRNARSHDMPLTATELRAAEMLREHGVKA